MDKGYSKSKNLFNGGNKENHFKSETQKIEKKNIFLLICLLISQKKSL